LIENKEGQNMDNKTQEFWNRLIQELEHLNRSLRDFLKALRHPGKHSEEPELPRENTEGKDDATLGEALLSLDAPLQVRQTRKIWYKTFDGWKSRIEIAAFAFGMGYAVVTFFQWRDSNRNFRTDQRAWVKLQIFPDATIPIDFTAGNVITVPVRISNVGKTVALNNKLFLFVDVLSPNQSPNLTHAGQDHAFGFHSHTGAFFPNAFNDLRIPRINPADGKEVPTTIEEAKDLAKYVAVYGTVEYDDIFGVHHWTNFCEPIVLAGSFNASACIDSNAVDHNE
jgi:hypothetical protein